jgi:NAD(P)-dependent dehydrogenase (short-subunit alcohol dehydrogenase family)
MMPFLALAYAVIVHVFLSSFRERSLLLEPSHRFWRMLVARVVFAFSFAFAERRAASIGTSSSGSAMADIVLVAISIATSVALILRTRRMEVDGPIPPSSSGGDDGDRRDLDGVVIFVTGANAGIGLETSRQLYHRGATVVLGCRSRTRAYEAMRSIDPDRRHDDDDIDAAAGGVRGVGRLHFVKLDLASFASVREAARALLSTGMPLHVLINNAGVMMRRREVTVDGIETTMAANHLGHFLLTNLLLPKLRESAVVCPSRVITVSSSLYLNAKRRRCRDGDDASMEPGIDLSDLQCERKGYSLFDQYAQSKLANVMFAIELGRKEKRRWQELQIRRLRDQNVHCEGGNNNQPENEMTSRTKCKKKLRPKLTPVDAPLMDDDEFGLGFNDIVPTPPLATKKVIACEGENNNQPADEMTFRKQDKKKLRPKLIPVDAPLMDNDEFGLGFNDIVRTPPLVTKKVKAEVKLCHKEERSKNGENLGTGTGPKLAPPLSTLSSCEDETGFDFGDVAVSTQQKPPSMKRNKARPKLIPVDSSFSSYDDETGLGFHDVVMSATMQSTPKEMDSKVHPKIMTLVQSTKTDAGDGKVERQHKSTTTNAATMDDAEESWKLSMPPVMSYCLHPGLVRTNVV